jgi:predicted nuclease of predicted toxin-antitoxin system
MINFSFIADMNISPQTVKTLLQHGWDILRVSDVLPANTPDLKILEFARCEGKIVITQDLDFSALLALSGYDHRSLITLRLLDSDPQIVTRRLLEVFPHIKRSLHLGCAVTMDEVTVRVRRLPINF